MNKNTKLKTILILVTCICIFVFILFMLNNNDNSTVIKDNVHVVSDEINTPIEVNDKELHFESNPGYKENDIVVSGVINHAPNGFVRKVIKVEDADNITVVHTENAMLTDVFEEAHISKVFLLSDTEAIESTDSSLSETLDFENTKTKANAKVFESVNDLIGMEQVYAESNNEYQFQKGFDYPLTENLDVEGNIGFNAWLQLDIDIESNEILWTMILHTETGGEMFVGCHKGQEIPFEKELFTKDLPSIEFLAGEVPIVITNKIESVIEGELGFEGEIGTTVGLDTKSSTGFQYSSIDNKVTDVSESEYLSDGIKWDTGASVQGNASIGVSLNLVSMLYDCTGASLGVGLKENNSAQLCIDPDTDTENPSYFGRIDLSITPQINGNIIVQSPVIDEELCSAKLFDSPFNPLWETSWESSDKWKTDFEEGIKKIKWYGTYSLIIKDIVEKKWIYNNAIYFPGVYYSPTNTTHHEGRGGITTGIPLDLGEVIFYTQEIGITPDGYPELILGKRSNNENSIIAIYSYDEANDCAVLVSWDEPNDNANVYLATGNMYYEGSRQGGEFMNLNGSQSHGWSAWRAEEDQDRLIDSNTLNWRSLGEW